MTTQTEALKLALEAFETLTQYNMVRANIFRRFEPTCTGDYVDLREFREKAKPAITAIKEALAQLEQEPYGYFKFNTGKFYHEVEGCNPKTDKRYLPLYRNPPQRTWEGLSVFEINDLVTNTEHGLHELVERTEKLLKEKNT